MHFLAMASLLVLLKFFKYCYFKVIESKQFTLLSYTFVRYYESELQAQLTPIHHPKPNNFDKISFCLSYYIKCIVYFLLPKS